MFLVREAPAATVFFRPDRPPPCYAIGNKFLQLHGWQLIPMRSPNPPRNTGRLSDWGAGVGGFLHRPGCSLHLLIVAQVSAIKSLPFLTSCLLDDWHWSPSSAFWAVWALPTRNHHDQPEPRQAMTQMAHL